MQQDLSTSPPQSHDLSPKNFGYSLLKNRGLTDLEINEFFNNDLKTIPDLYDLIDLTKSAKRIISAIKNNEKIAVYGDYDVDGTTSCALLYHFFKKLNENVLIIQPSRFEQGYGLHNDLIDQAVEKNITVLITVDCGITNEKAALYAKEKNIDLIITDHHSDTLPEMPKAFSILNPNRRDEKEDSKLKELAGVGVAFCLALEIRKQLIDQGEQIPSIYDLLQFVAIGTICDLAPLKTINPCLVRHGLRQIPSTNYSGIKTFLSLDERKLDFIPSEKLSFNIGPMINSKGRLEHPDQAFQLLIQDDIEQARSIYHQLEIVNNDRKFIQNNVFKEAKEQVIKNYSEINDFINVVYSPDWHEGVIGIVASKLVETFKVPAIVLTDSEEGIIKASARSAGSLDLFSLLKENSELFNKFGGHKKAAGLSMPIENLGPLKENLLAQLKPVPESLRKEQTDFDLKIPFDSVEPWICKEIDRLEPFGPGNSRPLFMIEGFELESFQILKDVHVKWRFKSLTKRKFINGISFNYIGKWNTLSPDEIFEKQNQSSLKMIANIGLNKFRGNEFLQFMVSEFLI